MPVGAVGLWLRGCGFGTLEAAHLTRDVVGIDKEWEVMHRIPHKGLLLVAVFALLLVPVAAVAGGTFDDVPDGDTFEADIEWLASVEVTKGCNPPANTEYCPNDAVTRGQMAAFMHRLADNVVDADTVDGLDAADLVSVYGATGGVMDDFFAAGFVSILSNTIDAPSDGYFHITTVTYAGDDWTMAGAGALGLEIYVDGSSVTPTSLSWFTECVVASNCGDVTTTMTAVVAVTQGSHMINLMAIENGFGTYLRGTSISTLFTPFGNVVTIAGPPSP